MNERGPTQLEGLTATITGGASGIGRKIAEVLAEAGAAIAIGDIDRVAAETAATELSSLGYRVVGLFCDVTQEKSVTEFVASAGDSFGRLDIHVNNAGFTRDSSMHRMTVDDFRAVLDVHVLGTWLGTRVASSAMKGYAHGGSIINMSSISGKVGNAGQTNYSAAKAGIVGLTKAAAKECARFGVRVNAIQPGLIDTEMTAGMNADVLASRIDEVPLGRIGTTDEVAAVALFLAGALSSYMTGNVLEVAGGRHM